jgi:hypothetical protein
MKFELNNCSNVVKNVEYDPILKSIRVEFNDGKFWGCTGELAAIIARKNGLGQVKQKGLFKRVLISIKNKFKRRK